jgi:hypothetical protein
LTKFSAASESAEFHSGQTLFTIGQMKSIPTAAGVGFILRTWTGGYEAAQAGFALHL